MHPAAELIEKLNSASQRLRDRVAQLPVSTDAVPLEENVADRIRTFLDGKDVTKLTMHKIYDLLYPGQVSLGTFERAWRRVMNE